MAQSGVGDIALAVLLDFPAAAELAEALLACRREPVCLDASGVDYLGATCLQVLLSAARTWGEDTQPFTVKNMSSAFYEGLARMGIAAAELCHQEGGT